MIKVVEVGLRDGLQSESKILNLNQKLQLFEMLAEAGLQDIEVGSFVRSERVPQLADTGFLFDHINANARFKKIHKWAFVPNEKGLDLAVSHKAYGIGLFCAVSNTFSMKNVNSTKANLLANIPKLLSLAKKRKIKARVYLSTSFHCPYEGWVSAKDLSSTVSILMKAGCEDVVISDTTGRAHPSHLDSHLAPLVKKYGADKFSLHLHDTQGFALANVNQALKIGLQRFDSAIAGLGGCPYAPGATGNIATEELVLFLQGYNELKKIKMKNLVEVGLLALEAVGKKRLPRMAKAGLLNKKGFREKIVSEEEEN